MAKKKAAPKEPAATRRFSPSFLWEMMPPPAQRAAQVPPTLDMVRQCYGPPVTFGVGAAKAKEHQLTMDSALSDQGFYTLLQHTFETGMLCPPQFLGYGQLQNLAQNGLIRACVSTVANDMTREWVEVVRKGEKDDGAGDLDGDGTDDVLPRIVSCMERLKVKDRFAEAVELTGYEGGCFLYIDTGTKDEDLKNPLSISKYSSELVKGGHLRFVVVDPMNCTPGDYNAINPLREDYFKPRWWWVLGKQVHSSRLLRFSVNELPFLLRPAYNFFGLPQAQILWDYVIHFTQCRDAENRLLRKFSQFVVKTNLFDSLGTLAPEGESQLNTRVGFMKAYMSNDGILVLDKDREDAIKLETPLSGVVDIVRQSLEFLAAINRTPAVKLLGISPSGFNATGDSDIRNYYDHIMSQQQAQMAAPLKTVLDCIQLHLFGEIDPNIGFEFLPLGEEDRKLQAEIRKLDADTAAVYLDRGTLSPEEVRQNLADNPTSGYASIDVDDVPETPDPLLAQTSDPLAEAMKGGPDGEGA